MLYEIECDKFAEKIGDKLVPRGKIQFHDGLNTVLGDKKAENSIGKSTFLLIVDFCFGGDDYTEKSNVVTFVGHHVINFTFKFGTRMEWYSRSTLNPTEVQICDSEYHPTGEVLKINDFNRHLFQAYQIQTVQTSWRDLIGRYARIAGRHNDNEEHPLNYVGEPAEKAIIALQKIFGVYNLVKEYQDFYEERNNRKNIRKKATELGEITTIAKTKKQVKENEKEIKKLEQNLTELLNEEDSSIAEQDTENLDKAAEIKGHIATLKRQRTRLVSQLNAVESNLRGGLTPTSDDIIELRDYFPKADIAKLETIENFHKKIQNILTSEMTDEVKKLEALISATNDDVKKMEEEQRKLGIPTHVSKKFLDETVSLRNRITFLRQQNEGYESSKILKAETKDAKTRLENARAEQLEIVETMINQEMVRMNDFIYNGTQYAPEIHFSNTRKGTPAYSFGCQWNTGTGENYKNMIIYDLSILKITELPVLIHDSLVFKNVADLPIDKIMQLYLQSQKQIFISFDKQEAYTDFTSETLAKTKVIFLYDNGGELFGWSWKNKNKLNM